MTTADQWVVFGVFAVLAAVALLGAAFVGAGRFGQMPDAVPDEYLPQLPDRPLEPDDLRTAQFAVVTRGYSPIQVDRLLARAARQWASERPFQFDGPADPPDAVPVPAHLVGAAPAETSLPEQG